MDSLSLLSEDVVSRDVLVTGSEGGVGLFNGGDAGSGGGGTGSEGRRAGGSVRVGGAGPR